MKSTELPDLPAPPALPPEIEALLAAERVLVVQPDDVRARALSRARASLEGRGVPLARTRSTRLWRAQMFVAAGVSLVIVTVCAAAFHGRRSTSLSSEPNLHREPAPKMVTAQAPVAGASPVRPAVLHDDERSQRSDRSDRRAGATKGSRRISAEGEGTILELRLLRQAREAVARDDFAAALAPILEHARRFPAGRLAEEREALRVRALSGLGRVDEARGAVAAFRARFPRSVLLPRVNEMLQAAP